MRCGASHLVVDPGIGLLHTIAKSRIRLPAKQLPDQRIVTVAPVDTPGRTQVVTASQLDARDRFDDIDELVDGYLFTAADVDRFRDAAVHQHLRPLEAVVDVHKTARLVAVAPNLDLVPTVQL